jgi:hypothetical protein
MKALSAFWKDAVVLRGHDVKERVIDLLNHAQGLL